MTITHVQWKEILSVIDCDLSLSNDNVIEKIKEKLKVEHQDVYEEWENNQFDVNYLFCAVYDNDLRTERVDKYTLVVQSQRVMV